MNELNAQADMFAMGFLMPEKEFKKVCKKYNNNVWLVSAHFQVPVLIKEQLKYITKGEKNESN